jgi:hypothetical protein
MDFKGDVKWVKAVAGFTVGLQGLPNGNTLIATRNGSSSDGEGKDVKTINLPGGGLIGGGAQMPDGGAVLSRRATASSWTRTASR